MHEPNNPIPLYYGTETIIASPKCTTLKHASPAKRDILKFALPLSLLPMEESYFPFSYQIEIITACHRVQY